MKFCSPIYAIIILQIAVCAASCGKSNTQDGNGINEALTTISCKNESAEDLWNANAVVGGRGFGFGFVGANRTASMVAGDVAIAKNVSVVYSFRPKDGDPKNAINKSAEYRGEKLAPLIGSVGEIEICFRDSGQWVLRAYERNADAKGKLLFEEEMHAQDGR